MNEQDYKNIIFKVEDRVATITINRPEVSNAIDHDTLVEMLDAFEWSGKSDDVGAIILTGAGKNFSAGGNLKNFKDTLEAGDYIHKERVSFAGKAAWDICSNPKPTIAMINGAAAGMGASLAAACDFRVFGPSSRFIMAFINVGLSGDTGVMFYLTKLIGVAKAKEIIMTGKQVSAEEAMQVGLATVVSETDEQLEEACNKFARRFARGATYALGKQKEVFSKIYYKELQEYTEIECQNLEDCSRHPDFKEAVFAFCEKRRPEFGKKN